MQRYQVSTRDFFWLMLAVALAVAWFLDHAVAWHKVADQRNSMKKFRVDEMRRAREYKIEYRDDEIRELKAENELLKLEIEEFKKVLFPQEPTKK